MPRPKGSANLKNSFDQKLIKDSFLKIRTNAEFLQALQKMRENDFRFFLKEKNFSDWVHKAILHYARYCKETAEFPAWMDDII